MPWLLAYAVGTLLGTAFLTMLPHALSRAPVQDVCATVLAGLVAFFLLERAMLWRHSHDPELNAPQRSGALILIGDAFHNLVDGVVIAAAFLITIPLGITASFAVIAHEFPQEVGD